MGNVKVIFDVTIGDASAGGIEMESRADVLVIAENFRSLCTGEKGMSESGRSSHFKGSVDPNFSPTWGCLTGGDITHGNGSGGELTYGTGFPDENYDFSHNGPGILSTAHADSYGNGSQFYSSTTPALMIDGPAVVPGKVTEGTDIVFPIQKPA